MLVHPPVPPTRHKVAVDLDNQTTEHLSHEYSQFEKSSYDFKQVTFTTNARSPRAPNHLPTGCESAKSKTDYAQKLQILPRGFCFPRRVTATTGCRHFEVPLRTPDRRQPGLYEKTTMRHHKMFRRSKTRLRVLLPPLLLLRRPPAPHRFSTYPARMYETPRMHETSTSHPADHRHRQQWPNEFRIFFNVIAGCHQGGAHVHDPHGPPAAHCRSYSPIVLACHRRTIRHRQLDAAATNVRVGYCRTSQKLSHELSITTA
ncbi:hypothetical protein HPB51_006992 [Rhipicephalus microplus]|uniref:Uncharacterized protein n=1 Tax=Rhipicephalus microplus TaxID=6941 RepID=A0A9J6D8P4_RHIMP|nr:hypothetical protein HPB51_006992 [Rhipicephalus microplus]